MANKESCDDLAALARGVRQLVEGFQRSGVQTIRRPSGPRPLGPAIASETPDIQRNEPRTAAAPTATSSAQVGLPQLGDFRPLNLPIAERQPALIQLACEVADCTACSELADTRTQTVFGVGTPAARLCLLGEAPGANEDKKGEPFVGAAGQLLDKILAACTLSREEVYILNVIKCRPPGNRNPSSDEVLNCRSFFERQLGIIQPEFICCLGSVAAQNLLDTTDSVGRMRGRLHNWNGIQVLVTYHPAYLLRNPSAKKEVWKDMQFLMAAMGIELPKRG